MNNTEQSPATPTPSNGVSKKNTEPERISISEVQALRVEAANNKVAHAQAEIEHAQTRLSHAQGAMNTAQLKLQKVLKDIQEDVCNDDQLIVGVLTEEMVVLVADKPKDGAKGKTSKK